MKGEQQPLGVKSYRQRQELSERASQVFAAGIGLKAVDLTAGPIDVYSCRHNTNSSSMLLPLHLQPRFLPFEDSCFVCQS